jgi:hypothetical protein
VSNTKSIFLRSAPNLLPTKFFSPYRDADLRLICIGYAANQGLIDYVCRIQHRSSSSLRVNLNSRNSGRWLRTLFKHQRFEWLIRPQLLKAKRPVRRTQTSSIHEECGVQDYQNDMFHYLLPKLLFQYSSGIRNTMRRIHCLVIRSLEHRLLLIEHSVYDLFF